MPSSTDCWAGLLALIVATHALAQAPAYAPVIVTQQDASGRAIGLVEHPFKFLVTGSNPAQSGEVLTVYSTGLGPTSPAVPPGTPAPVSTPAVTTTTPIVNVGCLQSPVISSQLMPGATGLYQVTFEVPPGIAGGGQPFSLSIGGQTSNALTLPVAGAAATGPAPSISLVANAFGEAALIAPNTWVEIKGTNLAPPGDSRSWLDADFVNNQLPTQLDGVSATVNGKAAYVYYISPTQVNILTPPDPISGPVQVCLAVGGATSNIAMVQAQPQSLSLFEFVSSTGKHYVYGRHASDNTLIGPPGLFPTAPALTTPVKPGETIYVAGNGFGTTDTKVIRGAMNQSGSLAKPWPAVQIGGIPADLSFAGLVGVGTYAFFFTVPQNVPDGDLALTVTYNGLSIQPNLFITVQH